MDDADTSKSAPASAGAPVTLLSTSGRGRPGGGPATSPPTTARPEKYTEDVRNQREHRFLVRVFMRLLVEKPAVPAMPARRRRRAAGAAPAVLLAHRDLLEATVLPEFREALA